MLMLPALAICFAHGLSLALAVPGWKLLRSLGGVGLVILGIIDSSVIPTFGSLDALTAILAIKNHELWPYYAAASATGSLIGAYITYRMSAKAGESWLEKRLGKKRSQQVRRLLEHWGFAAVFVSCIAPPPFPTSAFFVGAGALQHPRNRFLAAVLAGRAVRYSVIAFLAARYGRTILRLLRHSRGLETKATLIGITLLAFAVIVFCIFSWRKLKTRFRRPSAQSTND